MTRMEINEIENRKSLEKINEMKSSLFEKISPGSLACWPLCKFWTNQNPEPHKQLPYNKISFYTNTHTHTHTLENNGMQKVESSMQ